MLGTRRVLLWCSCGKGCIGGLLWQGRLCCIKTRYAPEPLLRCTRHLWRHSGHMLSLPNVLNPSISSYLDGNSVRPCKYQGKVALAVLHISQTTLTVTSIIIIPILIGEEPGTLCNLHECYKERRCCLPVNQRLNWCPFVGCGSGIWTHDLEIMSLLLCPTELSRAILRNLL